ncbi:MAG: sulfatase [Saprospiraceae bacterium]|nr:sulfatase [Saprospiraceae bacterium]
MVRYFAFLGLILMLSCTEDSSAPPEQATTPVNVLWLVAEDLSPYLPMYGDSTVETPSLSRLADEGVTYTHCFSVSGVCSPSRACLATGMYPSSIGALHMRTLHQQPASREMGLIDYEAVPPPDVKMVSELMRSEGYYCTNNSKQDYQFHPAVTAWNESSVYAHWRNRPDTMPFFSIFNFEVTHESQIFNPKRSRNLRYDKPVWPPTRGAGRPPIDGDPNAERPLLVAEDLEVTIPPYLPDTEPVRRDVRRMYSNIVELDRYLGRVIGQLEEDGLMDQTIIVFYGDHGGPLPRQKRLCYDSGLQVPLIIRYPDGLRAGTTSDRLVSFVDFAPTLLSMAGIRPPDHMQGHAFAGEHKGAARQYVHAAGDRFDECVDMIRAVRDQRYKYLKNYHTDRPYYLPVEYRERMATTKELLRMKKEGTLNALQAQWFRQDKDPEELFDTKTDPHELHNLADDPAYADKLAELRLECERWMDEIEDQGRIPEEELIKQFWPGKVQPITQTPIVTLAGADLAASCATEGASIGYRFVGEEQPSQGWRLYTGPIMLRNNAPVEVIAHRIGYAPSSPVMLQPDL